MVHLTNYVGDEISHLPDSVTLTLISKLVASQLTWLAMGSYAGDLYTEPANVTNIKNFFSE